MPVLVAATPPFAGYRGAMRAALARPPTDLPGDPDPDQPGGLPRPRRAGGVGVEEGAARRLPPAGRTLRARGAEQAPPRARPRAGGGAGLAAGSARGGPRVPRGASQ